MAIPAPYYQPSPASFTSFPWWFTDKWAAQNPIQGKTWCPVWKVQSAASSDSSFQVCVRGRESPSRSHPFLGAACIQQLSKQGYRSFAISAPFKTHLVDGICSRVPPPLHHPGEMRQYWLALQFKSLSAQSCSPSSFHRCWSLINILQPKLCFREPNLQQREGGNMN